MVQLEGEKMSKSKGNVVSPQAIVEEYGADTARLFMMQAAQPERDFDWSEQGVASAYGFLTRLKETVEAYAAGDIETVEDAGSTAGYVAREAEAAVVIATEEYDELVFNTAVREAQSLVGTLRQYREDTAVHAETFERGLSVALKLLSPVAPHICEDLWETLGYEGFIVDASWPEADADRETIEKRRRLVENTREDVRQIIDVAGIDDPEQIDIVVTPEWKHEALNVAIESDAPNVIPALMERESIKRHGDDAASYGQQLQENRKALQRTLDPETERKALESAAWLIEREFDAEVRVLSADETSEEMASEAEPSRPAIDITE
jgi:leucyl-tRNA synthetase